MWSTLLDAELCFLLFVLLVAVVVGLIYHGKINGFHVRERLMEGVIHKAKRFKEQQQCNASLARLRHFDPEFDESEFLDRVTKAHKRIRQAWTVQDFSSLRAFISDSLYERFRLRLQEQQELGYPDAMDDVAIERMRIVKAESDFLFDTVHVAIVANTPRAFTLLESNSESLGTIREQSVEYWTFLRRRNVKTVRRSGLMEGSCPNCGADVTLNQFERCTACESVLRSGLYDWVLSKITQASDFHERLYEQAINLSLYRDRFDSALNVQYLEDRSSVIFWRKLMARRLGDVRPLAKVASADFCRRYQQQLQEEGPHCFWGECTLGDVFLSAILPGEPMDRLVMDVRWRGTLFRRATSGQPPQRTGRSAMFRHFLVLGRRSGTTTNVEHSISSAHCPNCGAPETELTAHSCQYCSEVLNDGKLDWVLLDFHSRDERASLELLHQARDYAAESNRDMSLPRLAGIEQLAWLVKMALADRQLDDRQRKLIRRVARQRNVPEAQVHQLIEAAEQGELDVPVPPANVDVREWLTSLIDVGLSDGHLSRDEFDLLCQAASHYQLSPYDVRSIVKHRRAELYRQARRQLA